MIYFLDIFGTFAFAVSGAFRAVKYEFDLLGVLILALVTGLAGGITRDVILGATPPAAMIDYCYVLTCISGGMCVFLAAPKIAQQWDYVMIADAIGLSVFTVIGAGKAELYNSTPLTIIFMAMLTACGGGILRDILVKEIPSILKSDFYASAAIIGGACFVLLGYTGINDSYRLALTIAITFVLRITAMRYGISLPRVKSLKNSPSHITREKQQRKQ